MQSANTLHRATESVTQSRTIDEEPKALVVLHDTSLVDQVVLDVLVQLAILHFLYKTIELDDSHVVERACCGK